MATQVFRKGAGKPVVLAGAAVAAVGVALCLMLLTLPELAPAGMLDLFGMQQPVAPTVASRLLGLLLAAGVAAGALFLVRVAPFLGGKHITVSEQGLEYADHDGWVTANWNDVQSVARHGETTGYTYTVATLKGGFSFSSWQIDRADDLAALIEARTRRP